MVEDYSIKPLVARQAPLRVAMVSGRKAARSTKFSLMSPRDALTGGGSRLLQGRGLASEQGPYTTGKRGSMALMNKRMVIRTASLSQNTQAVHMGRSRKKGNIAMLNKRMVIRTASLSQNTQAVHVGRSRKKGSIAMLNRTMLLKSGALQNSKAIHVGRRPRGKVSQLNVTMMIKGGAMTRDDAIRPHRSSRFRVPRVAWHRSVRVRRFSRMPIHRDRSPVGGRCFGTNCDD